MTRAEHLAWCKKRALALLPDNPTEAWSSMVSDLNKHDETRGHIGINLGMMQLMGGSLSTPQQMRDFIQGFN